MSFAKFVDENNSGKYLASLVVVPDLEPPRSRLVSRTVSESPTNIIHLDDVTYSSMHRKKGGKLTVNIGFINLNQMKRLVVYGNI